jgi:hypothetical protein
MDNSFDNSIDNFDDNIREPDEVKYERLIEDNRTDFQKQMDEALYTSMEDFKKQQEIYDNYEEELKKEYLNEVIKRREKFKLFILDLNKLIKFDKEIKEIYDIIEPIIDNYCTQYIEICKIDIITYDKIFETLNKTRANKQALEFLKTIILKE